MEKTTIRYAKTDNTDEYIRILYAKEGNTEFTKKLWEDHVQLVRTYVYRKYSRTQYFEREELVAQCYHYFLDAIRKFDIELGFKFSNFLTNNLQQLSRYVIQLDSTITRPTNYASILKKNEDAKVSSVSISSIPNSNGTAFADYYPEEGADKEVTSPFALSRASDYIEELLITLPPLRRSIIELSVMKNLDPDEVCVQLQIDKIKYRNERKSAMKQLQELAKITTLRDHLHEIIED